MRLPNTIFALLTAIFSAVSLADTQLEMSVTPFATPKFDFDKGGQASLKNIQANFSLSHNIYPQHNLGFNIQLARESWSFDSNPWKVAQPWQTLERISFSLPYRYTTSSGWIFAASADLSQNKEKGAENSDSWLYGLNTYMAHSFSPDLLLGFGVGAYHQFDKTTGFPFIIIDWKITKDLRLANPFAVGPAGPAGLELSWGVTPQFDLGVGGAMRHFQYRLAADNAVASKGILEQQYVPIFIRAGYKIQDNWRVDAYTGVAAGGKFTFMDKNGNELNSEKAKKMPFFGLSANARF